MSNDDIFFGLCPQSDLGKTFELYREREKWFAEQGIDQWVNYTKRFPRAYFAQAINNKTFYILKDKNFQITAACVLNNEDSEIWGETKNAAFIKNFVSGKSGSGGVLLDRLAQECKSKGIQTIRLDCWANNERLVDYYKKAGFDIIKIIKAGYGDGDMCLMSKSIH